MESGAKLQSTKDLVHIQGRNSSFLCVIFVGIAESTATVADNQSVLDAAQSVGSDHQSVDRLLISFHCLQNPKFLASHAGSAKSVMQRS